MALWQWNWQWSGSGLIFDSKGTRKALHKPCRRSLLMEQQSLAPQLGQREPNQQPISSKGTAATTFNSLRQHFLLLLPAIVAFQPPRNTPCSYLNRASSLQSHHQSIEVSRQSFISGAAASAIASLLVNASPAVADDIAAPPPNTAIYAYRSGGLARLTTLGLAKLTTRYEGYVISPKGYSTTQVPISFDYPTDWLQLDKLGGGIQYVDGKTWVS